MNAHTQTHSHMHSNYKLLSRDIVKSKSREILKSVDKCTRKNVNY